MVLNFEKMLVQAFVLATGFALAEEAQLLGDHLYEPILDGDHSCVREPRAFGGCLDDCDSPQFCMKFCEDNHPDETTFVDYWANAAVCEENQCWCNCYTHTCDAAKSEVREIPDQLGARPVLTYQRTALADTSEIVGDQVYEVVLDGAETCARDPRLFGGCLDGCDSALVCMELCNDRFPDDTTFIDYWAVSSVCGENQCWCNCYEHDCTETRVIPEQTGARPIITYKRTAFSIPTFGVWVTHVADNPGFFTCALVDDDDGCLEDGECVREAGCPDVDGERTEDPWQLIGNIRTTCKREPRAFGGCLDDCPEDSSNRTCHDYCLENHGEVTKFIDVWTNDSVCSGENRCWCNCYEHTCAPGKGQVRDVQEDKMPVWTFRYLDATAVQEGPWLEVLDENTTCKKDPRAFGECIDDCNFGQGCKDHCLANHGDVTTFIDVWTSNNVCAGDNRCWCNCYEHTCDADKGEVREIVEESGLRPVFTYQYIAPPPTPSPTESPTKSPSPSPTHAFCSTYEFYVALCREVTRWHKPDCKARGCLYDKFSGHCTAMPRGEELTCKKIKHELTNGDGGEHLCECYTGCTPRYKWNIKNFIKCVGKHSWE